MKMHRLWTNRSTMAFRIWIGLALVILYVVGLQMVLKLVATSACIITGFVFVWIGTATGNVVYRTIPGMVLLLCIAYYYEVQYYYWPVIVVGTLLCASWFTKAEAEDTMSDEQVTEYWQRHAALKAKHLDDAKRVRDYLIKFLMNVEENEQIEGMRTLLSCFEHCVHVLEEDERFHISRGLKALDDVNTYIVELIIPFMTQFVLPKVEGQREFPTLDDSTDEVSEDEMPSLWE